MFILTGLAKENFFEKIEIMATRTDDLTEFAGPVADRLTKRFGTLKNVLSAAVMALDKANPDEREYFMSLANGEEVERPQTLSSNIEQRLAALLDQFDTRILARPTVAGSRKRAKPAKSG